MKKFLKLGLGSVIVASALGTVLVPAVSASADASVCAAGDDALDVPYGFAADFTPELAGTACFVAGTTRLDSVWVAPGWSAQVKSDGTGGGARTEVRFTNATTGDQVELRDEPGRVEIK